MGAKEAMKTSLSRGTAAQMAQHKPVIIGLAFRLMRHISEALLLKRAPKVYLRKG